MNYHVKALMAFLGVHGIVIGGGRLYDKVALSLCQVTNDNYSHDVGEVFERFGGKRNNWNAIN